MNFEQNIAESDEARTLREAMRDVSNFRLNGSITAEQFFDNAKRFREAIIGLLDKKDPSALELAKRFNMNFSVEGIPLDDYK